MASGTPAGARVTGAEGGNPPGSAVRRSLRDRLDDLSTPGGLLLVAALLITGIAVTSSITDPDFWWHLRTGQLLIANHLQLLGTSPYIYTVPTHHWTMHEWLFEVGVAGLYDLGGLAAIVPVLSLLTWVGVVFLLLRSRYHTRNRLALGVGLIVAALAANPIWGPRDQMVDFTFSCLLLLMIERHLIRGGRALWFMPPLFLLWSNLHGGFVVGLFFAALIVVAELAGGRLGFPDRVPGRRIGTLAGITVLSTLVSMINPNGPGILLYAAETLSSPAQQALILEWQSPDFHQLEVRGFAVMLITLAGFLIANRRIRARDAALVAATTALAFESVRNVAIFVAATTPIWIEQLSRILDRLRASAALEAALRRGRAAAAAVGALGAGGAGAATAAPGGDAAAPVLVDPGPGGGQVAASAAARRLPPFRVRVTALALITAALLAGWIGVRLVPAMATTPTALSYAENYPVCASAWLRSAPHDLRIFNQYGEGGYLSWSLAGTGDRIFIFGDAALMGDTMLYTYADVADVTPQWESILLRYGTQVVLFDTGTALDHVLEASPRWVMVYSDPHNQAFVLRSEQASLHLPPQPRPTGTCAQLAATGSGGPAS
ncbi:MAG: hypothetical protein ABR977_04115 [Candidatus Dormibacteria bacterium]|jgi:hypothetical protein